MPPENCTLLNVMMPVGSVSVTLSEKPVIGLPRLSSAVIVKASGLPAVGLVFEALTTNFAVAVGETVTFAVTDWPGRVEGGVRLYCRAGRSERGRKRGRAAGEDHGSACGEAANAYPSQRQHGRHRCLSPHCQSCLRP